MISIPELFQKLTRAGTPEAIEAKETISSLIYDYDVLQGQHVALQVAAMKAAR